jgi:LysR family glycine cleavage system transcriptional activator
MGAQVLDAAAAMRGQGVALLTPLFWRHELAAGRLVAPLPHVLDGGWAYWLVYPRNRAEWPKIRRFSAWLHGLCGKAKAPAGSERSPVNA